MSNNLVYTKRLIRKSSSRIIIPLIISLSLVIRSSLFIRRRAAEDYSSVDASNGIAIVLIFLSLPYIFSTKGIQVIKLLFKSKIRIYLYFVLWSLVSVLWSTNVIYSAFRGVELLINLFLIGYIFYIYPLGFMQKKY